MKIIGFSLMKTHNEEEQKIVTELSSASYEDLKNFSLTMAEMADYVKQFFSEEAACQFINMYYHFAIQYNKATSGAMKIMDGIIPAIQKRHALHAHIDIDAANQVNMNPQHVHNYSTDTNSF